MASETLKVEVQKVDRLSQTRVRLSVAVPQEEISSRANGTVQRLQKTAKIPGFRPGKAPASIVQSRYKEQIEQDVVSKLLEEGLGKAVEDSKLYPVNRPKVDIKQTGFNGKKGMLFEAEFEVRPEIEIKHYKKIPIKNKEVKVSDKEIDESLKNIQERYSTLEPLESKKAEKGNFVVLKAGMEMLDGDKKSDEPKEYTLELGEGKLLPELEKNLVGFEVGTKKDIPVEFPKDYSEKTLAGRKAIFHCELLELKKKNLPKLDDDFAKQVTGGKDLAALKEELKKEMIDGKTQEQTTEQRNQILDYLIEKHEFEAPASMVAQRMKSLVEQTEADLKQRGQAFPDLSEEEVSNLKKVAEKQVKGSLLLAALSAKENIVLDTSQVNARVESIAKQINKSVEDTSKWLEGKGYLTPIHEQVLTDQVFAFLVEHASIKTS